MPSGFPPGRTRLPSPHFPAGAEHVLRRMVQGFVYVLPQRVAKEAVATVQLLVQGRHAYADDLQQLFLGDGHGVSFRGAYMSLLTSAA